MSQDPGHTFSSLSLSSVLLEVVRELGYIKPTPIQAETIPLLLQGKDVIGQSQTGSGKTAAFTLPILQSIQLSPRRIQALILCPTRELCAQVAREVRKLGRRHAGLQVLILSGGAPLGPQRDALEKGVHLVVGTPGRVLDLLQRGKLELSGLRTFVLDEADRMLEMGFQDDMERILAATPKDRQTVLFSATYPSTIEALSRKYQRAPTPVRFEAKAQAPVTIRQLIFKAESRDRLKVLLWIIEQNRSKSAIVFCNFKASVIALAAELKHSGASAGELHGDLEQRERDRVMAQFRNHSLRILIATDVAARGLDIDDVDLVVNFELPFQPEIYVHRVGRTGRAGQRGLAVSLCSDREEMKVGAIERYIGAPIQRKTAPVWPPEKQSSTPLSTGNAAEATMRTLFIGAGRKEKMRPGDILGALTGEAGGLQGSDIGKIEIHDRFSYVAVSAEISARALVRLRNGKIKGRKFRIEAVR